MGAETTRQLRWLMILRVVTVTTLLISAFAIQLVLLPAGTLRPLFTLAAVAYGMVLLYAVLWALRTAPRFLLRLQLAGDALLVTGFVGITGGLDSPMSFLYLLPISVASMVLHSRGGLLMAGVSWVLYTSLLAFGPTWLNSGPPLSVWMEQDPVRVWYGLVVLFVGMLTVALLAAYLAERLDAQGHELAERKAAVARLQALNENIIESINSGLVTTDLAGRINFINRGGCEITGLDPEEFEQRTVESVFGLGEDFLVRIRGQLAAQRRFRFERYFETGEGRAIYLGFAASNLHDRTGRPLGFLFIFQDLTEIRALEQEVRIKERMAALGEMAAGLAHELRNPLAAISGSVQYLKGDLSPDGETLELMDNVLRESQRLDVAIKDFLTFARPGRFSPAREDVVRLLEDSIKLLRKSEEFSDDHRIDTRYAAREILYDVDANRMKQVFWNLASNALKAMPDGGTLTIAAEVRDGNLEILFADRGAGMTEQEQRQYFQPFSSSFSEGTGLGAAIVYRLVEEHGGRISLDSAPGEGTRVRIVIPARTEGADDRETSGRVALTAGG